jgi:PAS domain S-box-containing protein
MFRRVFPLYLKKKGNRPGEVIVTILPEVTQVQQLEQRITQLEAALHTKDQQLSALMTSLKPIREGLQKSGETASQQSRDLLQLVLDTIPARVLWKDRQGVFLGCNQLGAADLGLPSPEAIIGTTDYDYFPASAADGFREADRAVTESGIPKLNFEEPLPRPDGSLLWLSTSKVPMRDTSGNTVGIMVSYEDITERKLAEQEREKLLLSEQEARREAQEALRLKDLFLATMSHELRTPLNAMIGFQHLMLYSGQLNEDNIHMTERTIANSQRLLNLINNILDISRIATGGLKIVPVRMSPRQLADGILTDFSLQAREKGLELIVRVDDSVPATIVHRGGTSRPDCA